MPPRHNVKHIGTAPDFRRRSARLFAKPDVNYDERTPLLDTRVSPSIMSATPGTSPHTTPSQDTTPVLPLYAYLFGSEDGTESDQLDFETMDLLYPPSNLLLTRCNSHAETPSPWPPIIFYPLPTHPATPLADSSRISAFKGKEFPLVHPRSLVHPAMHSAALLELIGLKMSPPTIDYIVKTVTESAEFAIKHLSSSIAAPNRRNFTDFVTKVINRTRVSTPTVLVSLVFLERAKPRLTVYAKSGCVLERIFLGAVIVAEKYVNDSALPNFRWASSTGVFDTRDVGHIERKFLRLLDYELRITECDLLRHHAALSEAARSSHISHTPHFKHPFYDPCPTSVNLPTILPELLSNPGSPSQSSSRPCTPPTPHRDAAIRDLKIILAEILQPFP